ncbi:uncharacterized protein LOC123407165 isoform X3 [Hordeum vulgare subsp. vulgare]|uniref:uncharacterized protein LOC123407165 isoform X3 n=1 Tax=Hordeum vulgare subsp. vulgare TaxID=112509 RepID=UPI001D1A593F|nr:uncharacterized protein LOC123407165 isoform X3 [Hordeum vulgare subsp. vulgare]
MVPLSTIGMEFSGSSGSFIYTPETQSEIATVIQGILLGLFLLPLLYKSSLRVWVYCRTLGKQQTEAIEKQAEKRAGLRRWWRLSHGLVVLEDSIVLLQPGVLRRSCQPGTQRLASSVAKTFPDFAKYNVLEALFTVCLVLFHVSYLLQSTQSTLTFPCLHGQ